MVPKLTHTPKSEAEFLTMIFGISSTWLGKCCLTRLAVYVVLNTALTSAVVVRQHGISPDVAYRRLETNLALSPGPYGFRSGKATNRNSCERVQSVPPSLQNAREMKPNGIQPFYTKYTEAYGIPVVGSGNVSDDALQRACYILRFLLADSFVVRQTFYKYFGRVAVIGANEEVTDLPDYANMSEAENARSRGLGATQWLPVASGAVENLLCYDDDRYFGEDILLHELAHGVHLIGGKYAIPGWQHLLEESYSEALELGLWNNTYSSTTVQEYLAEGVQSYFRANGYSATPDGIHGPVDSPEKLLSHEPDLYNLIYLLFPCKNTFLLACHSSREMEAAQVLTMDCDLSAEYQINLANIIPDSCYDKNRDCEGWAHNGECTTNPDFMNVDCRKSCKLCGNL